MGNVFDSRPTSLLRRLRKYQKKSFGQHFLLLSIATLLGSVLVLINQILLGRLLGAEDFGLFATAFTTVSTPAPLIAAGIAHFWLAAFAEEKYSALRWLHPSLLLSTLVALVLSAGIIILASQFGINEQSPIVIILTPILLAQGLFDLVHARLQVEERFTHLSFWLLVPHTSRLLVVLLGFLFGLQVFSIAVGYAIVASLTFFFGTGIILGMRKNIILPGLARDTLFNETKYPTVVSLAGKSFWYSLSSGLALLYFNIPLLTLGWLTDNKNAGVYAVAMSLMMAATLLPTVLYQKLLLPRYHRLGNDNPLTVIELARRFNRLTLAISALVSLVYILFADKCIIFLFGDEFIASTPVLIILALDLPVRYSCSNLASLLSTRGYMAKRTRVIVIALMVNITLCMLAASHYASPEAVAISFLFAELTLLLLYTLLTIDFQLNLESCLDDKDKCDPSYKA